MLENMIAMPAKSRALISMLPTTSIAKDAG